MNFESRKHNNTNSKIEKTSTRRGFLRDFGLVSAGAVIGFSNANKFNKETETPKIERPNPDEYSETSEYYESETDKEYREVLTRLLQEIPEADSVVPPRTERGTFDYKKRPEFNFLYLEKLEEPKINNIDLLGKINRFGMLDSFSGRMMQTMRFQILTMAAERLYNLPHNLILAMILQESGGEEFLPNSLGDGGFGLCHIQPATAQEFDLRVFKNCNAIVCNGEDHRSCVDPNDGETKLNHAKELKNQVERYKDDRGHLSRIDDRLNHLNNLDAVGRMLAFHIQRYPESKKGLNDSWGPLRTAVGRYSGPTNAEKNWQNVSRTMSLLNDESYKMSLYSEFNDANLGNRINGKLLNAGTYVSEWEKFFMHNYGVANYIDEPCYTTPVSNDILKTYKNFLPQINDPYRQASL